MSEFDISEAIFRKSSRSTGNGGACVEVALNLVSADWRKSSAPATTAGPASR